MTTIFYILGAILGWILFYYIVKAAVREGVIAAFAAIDKQTGRVNLAVRQGNPDKLPSTAQARLQERYDKGEITFEVFRSEWDKLDK